MNIHLIAIGGAVMHNLALTLQANGHFVTGSDDEIYDPAKSRLAAAGLLPNPGWYPDKLNMQTDVVIVGMHARPDNPELLQALALKLPVFSYPAFIFLHAKEKIRVVVAGSHGKTTTTAMVMHVLRHAGLPFDYLVGASLEGFDRMVGLSDAPILIAEGDEYYASPLDPTAKMVHYKPHVAAITGIAWDHINVFPTFQAYLTPFRQFLEVIEPNGRLFYAQGDQELENLVHASRHHYQALPYAPYPSVVTGGKTKIVRTNGELTELRIFGDHNLANAKAASLICAELGVDENRFLEAIQTFRGASRRLEVLAERPEQTIWLDFAHAPSKVRATVKAAKRLYPNRKLSAILELHTFSSLNRDFLPQYAGSLEFADAAAVFVNPHTFIMKNMPPVSAEEIKKAFAQNVMILSTPEELTRFCYERAQNSENILLMTSGNFGGIDFLKFAKELFD